MIKRPKPDEDEDDLLKLQEEFLASSGSQFSWKPVRNEQEEGNVAMDEGPDDRGHITVLANIIEKDTKNEIYQAPLLGHQAFPKVQHLILNKEDTMTSSMTRKKSLFACHVEAHNKQTVSNDTVKENSSPTMNTNSSGNKSLAVPGSSCVITGTGLGFSNHQSESLLIHEENCSKISAMSETEIREEQQSLQRMMDPKLVEFLRNKRKAQDKSIKSTVGAHFNVNKECTKKHKSDPVPAEELMEQLPVTPNKDWLHMDSVETEKMEWMKDLPPTSSISLTRNTARFDFQGNLMCPDANIPLHMGLHHHGDEPLRAGYSLEEIFLLARSSNVQQRSLALHTLARIISQSKAGHFTGQTTSAIIPSLLAGGVVMLLRWALDESTVTAAVDALHALLCNPLDQEAMNKVWVNYQGHISVALTPSLTLEQESAPVDDDEENKEVDTDADIVGKDVIQTLVHRMELLARFCYIFQSLRPQTDTVIQMLNILSRIAQHSLHMASEVVQCSGLLDLIFKHFLPTSWIPADKHMPSIFGVPVSAAMHLVLVLCQAGKTLASILVFKFNLNLTLLRYLAVSSSQLELPEVEAVNLQAESLAVWRVCITYGLSLETYFDLYSNILQSLAKLESHWSSSSGYTSSHQLSGTDPFICAARMICVLEKLVCVAGRSKQHNQDFNSSNNKGRQQVINWSHVTALFQPIRCCTVCMLNDLALSYPNKKQDLSLLTACLNFLATYMELEEKQNESNEVSSLLDIEQFCSACLIPVWSSYGLSVIIENISSCSNLLAPSSSQYSETTKNLPSLGVCQVVENGSNFVDAYTQWTSNMPILRSSCPFGFLVALLRLMLAVCHQHKDMIPKVLDATVNNKDIMLYLSKCCSNMQSPFKTAFLTRTENWFHYFWLKSSYLWKCQDMTLAHKVALQLLCRVLPGDEHIVHDLMSTVIFSPRFICEGEDTVLALQAVEDLSLSEVVEIRTATQEQIQISKHQILQKSYSALAEIRGHFLLALRGMDKVVQDSRNIFFGNFQEIKTQVVNGVGGSLLPQDWMFLPLVDVYNRTNHLKCLPEANIAPKTVSTVTSALLWVYALEIWRPFEINFVSITLRLTRVMCAFIIGNDLFLEKSVNQSLAGLLQVFTSTRFMDQMDFDEKVPGIVSFYDLYQEFLEHYEAVSFGDTVFGQYVLLPLQQKHSCLLRKAVWGERRKLLRTLRLTLKEMLIPLHNYLQPEETDVELLQLYLSAMITKCVEPAWSPVMYLIAVHHINRFIYISHPDGKQAIRGHFWGQILAGHENLVRDIIYYKQTNTNRPQGMDFYETLPPNRQRILQLYKYQNVTD